MLMKKIDRDIIVIKESIGGVIHIDIIIILHEIAYEQRSNE